MKNSLYEGKVLNLKDIWSIYQILKFYYEDLESLPPLAISDIMELEFGCIVSEKDVYLYLLTAQNRDSSGNLKCHD